MKRFVLPTAIAALTLGVLLGGLWLRHRHMRPALTFTGGEMVDAFQVWYECSDGQTVTYTNLDWESSDRAAKELENEGVHMQILERVPNFNGRGERRVVTRVPEWGSGSQVMWTDESHLFIIYASDVRHAVAFEKSGLWEGNSYSVRPLPIQEYLKEKMAELNARKAAQR